MSRSGLIVTLLVYSSPTSFQAEMSKPKLKPSDENSIIFKSNAYQLADGRNHPPRSCSS